MHFSFYLYIFPTWYFNLTSKGTFAYFPDYDLLTRAEQALLDLDLGYSDHNVAKLDAAYQSLNKGFIMNCKKTNLDSNGIHPTLNDNYRFIRKYFHPIWSWYVMVLRLLTLHHPGKEIYAFLRQRNVRRIKLYDKVYPHMQNFRSFESKLLISAPKVTVIIPTLNRYSYLKDALHDLEKQDYPNFDVIIIDQSAPYKPEFYDTFLLVIKVIRQEEKALWLARNSAIKRSDAQYLLLYDDDSRVENDWISQHIKCLDYFHADISSGISISFAGSKVPENYCFFRWSDQLDTGNVLIPRFVFEKIGLFDRQFEKERQGDGEFGLRAYLAGFRNVSNPLAHRLHLKVSEGGLRQMGSWDGFRPKSWLAPRPVPSVLYMYRKYFGPKAALYAVIPSILPSLMPYSFKRNKLLMLVGVFQGIILTPLLVLQIVRSWQRASIKLLEGPKIENLLPL